MTKAGEVERTVSVGMWGDGRGGWAFNMIGLGGGGSGGSGGVGEWGSVRCRQL